MFSDHALGRPTDRHTVGAVLIEHHQRARKHELKYSMRLERDPKVGGPAVDWHEAFAFTAGDVLRIHRNLSAWDSKRPPELRGANACKNTSSFYVVCISSSTEIRRLEGANDSISLQIGLAPTRKAVCAGATGLRQSCDAKTCIL